jgi:hypothetical protein
MDRKIKASMQTLSGVITPYDWDEHGNVLNVSLSATDDEEYVIENGLRFLSLIQQSIRATGIVKSGKKIHRMINVKKYRMLDSAVLLEQGHPNQAPTIDNTDFDDSVQPLRHSIKRYRHEKKRS